MPKLKTVTVDGKTLAEVQDGMPIYVGDDGKDTLFDLNQALSKIAELSTEEKGIRKKAGELAESLKAFEGLGSVDDIRKAVETVRNLKDGELVTAGKAAEIKAQALKEAEDRINATKKAADEEIAKITRERDETRAAHHGEMIGNAFSRSKFIAEKVGIPVDMVQSRFGNAFKVEDGKIVAYRADGQRVTSRSKILEPAEFDEALEILVDAYPYRDHILKGAGGGSGSRGGSGTTGGKTILRKDFEALDHGARAARMAEGVKVVDAA